MKTALVDADSIIYIVTYNKKDEIAKTLEECKEKLDEMIINILNYTHSTHYLLTLTIGKNFRYEIRDDYKANRKSNKPEFFKECRAHLIDYWGAISNENLESDDLVNIYKNNIENSFIAACDSDILKGLEGKHFDYRNFKWITTTKEEAQYKFWHDMIAGTHNGIKGIPGKGTKHAQNIFDNGNMSEFNLRDITFNEYISNLGEEIGIEEFYKNYRCQKIKDKWEGITIPEPIKFEREMDEWEVKEEE